MIFFSKIKKNDHLELQDAKGAAKEQEAIDKVSKAEARAVSKTHKEFEAQGKREDRTMRSKARKAKKTHKESKLNGSRSRKAGMLRSSFE